MGVELAERDIFKEPLTEAELGELTAMRPIRDLFSFKSPSFRKLGLDPDSLTDQQMKSLIVGEPRLIRRPLVVTGGQIIVGNDQAALKEAFGQGVS